MGCNCKMMEAIIGIVVIVFALWMTTASKWILVIAGVLLLLHSFKCKGACAMPEAKSKGKKKK